MSENKTEIQKFIQNQINETQFLINESLYHQNIKLTPRFNVVSLRKYILC